MIPFVRLDSSRTDAAGRDWRRPAGPARRVLLCDVDRRSTLTDEQGTGLERWENPLDAIGWLGAQRSEGYRWIGYFSYDLNPLLEPAVGCFHQPQFPLFAFSEHPLHDYSAAPLDDSHAITSQPLGANFTPDEYLRAVARAIAYIGDGDIFQVNLAQQLRLRTDTAPQQIYAHIQGLFPAWYAALLDYGEFSLVSNSPELFLRTWRERDSWHIETRPIKGTRPRRAGMREELRSSIKDQAELNMIVDLERNDLGRICRIGSVRVVGERQIEEHPTVYHGSATVTGELRDEITLLDILKATFPGGSITGAPKIRAMQIIHELEPQARGPYCGAIGYLDADGSMQFSIAIRTLLIRGNEVHVPVGGGIVADSEPAAEYDETLVKARAALAALGVSGKELSGWEGRS